MKVILLQDIPHVGRKYDIKDVAGGYAANFLFPKRLAEPATKKRLESVEGLQVQREAEVKIQKDLLAKNFESIKDVSVTISAKANEQGHLFQGIHKEDITAALKAQARIDLPPDFIQLPHPLKEVGEYQVTVSADDRTAFFKVIVTAS